MSLKATIAKLIPQSRSQQEFITIFDIWPVS